VYRQAFEFRYFLHSEPSLDASSLQSNVKSSTKFSLLKLHLHTVHNSVEHDCDTQRDVRSPETLPRWLTD